MKYLYQFALIASFSYGGELIVSRLGLPIPGSMLGLILFFLCLYFKIVRIDSVRVVGNWLKQNLAVFFVPACVGIMSYFDIIKDSWFQIISVMVISTLITFFVSGKTAQTLSDKERKRS